MILLIGNFLSKHGLNPTAIEDLATALSNRYEIKTSSYKKKPFFRLLDMVMSVINNRKECQLIIIDVFSTYALIFSGVIMLMSKYLKLPYVPVLRGGYLPERYKKHPHIFNFLLSDARTIISPSEYLQESFQNNSFSVTVIPNYIDLKKYSFKTRKKIKPHLLWVRSIHNIYNPSMAIHVLGKIRKIYPDAQLCMVGPVKDNRVMEQLKILISRLDLQNHVLFSGQLSKIEWTALSKDYDIFINTTDYDNNPVTLLESMALGLPIVSTNVGGVPYLIDDNVTGLLVEAKKSEQMVEKINELISGKIDGYQIARNAREAVSHYDKNEIIKQWCQTINELN